MLGLKKLIAWLILVFVGYSAAFAQSGPELLPPDRAFALSSKSISRDSVTLSWVIAEGYYLYRDKFKFSTLTPDITLGEPVVPTGKTQHDDYFGDVEILRGDILVTLPIKRANGQSQPVLLDVSYQGCADIGVCYPPEKKTLTLQLPVLFDAVSANPTQPTAKIYNPFTEFGLTQVQDELLPPDQAFRFFADVSDGNTLRVSWQIADGYYLYREKFAFSLLEATGIRLGELNIPRGEPTHDEAFGQVEIFHQTIEFDLPLLRSNLDPISIKLRANYQGCADRGVCYPPIQKTVDLELPAGAVAGTVSSKPSEPLSEQGRIASALQHDALWLTAISFFGFGLVLAFTPCVLPMIPILSGLIIGHGEKMTTRRAFFLSLSYVLASALMYTVFGVLAGVFGSNLQVLFQSPWIIVSFSAVFVLLALSMFDFYTLQMPVAIQSRLVALENRQHGGSLIGAFIMGALSALIVGPCVAAPLAGALIYIGQTGDAVLGGLALFAMGMGMGFPLLLLGASAGKLLPKAGAWMNATKAVFGVILLGVAVWLLERIIPASVTLLLWAILLIVSAIYMHAVDALPQDCSGWQRLWKGCGIIMLIYGITLIVGVTSGGRDPFQPLAHLAGGSGVAHERSLNFQVVKSLADFSAKLDRATQNGQWVMLDYYADWCISCKEMDRYTFSDERVQLALSNVLLLQADVTKDNAQDKELLEAFGLIGPPATLFFALDKQERRGYRVVGYKDADEFLRHIKQIIPNV